MVTFFFLHFVYFCDKKMSFVNVTDKPLTRKSKAYVYVICFLSKYWVDTLSFPPL